MSTFQNFCSATFRLASTSLFVCVLFLSSARAGEISPSLQAKLSAAESGSTLAVIVTFTAKADLQPLRAQVKTARRLGAVRALRETADRAQGAVRALLRARGKAFQTLWVVDGMSLDAAPDLIRELAARPEVARIELNATLQLPAVTVSQDFRGGMEYRCGPCPGSLGAEDYRSGRDRGGAGHRGGCQPPRSGHADTRFRSGGWFNAITPVCGQTIDGATIEC